MNRPRPNLLYKTLKASWMMDPITAGAASRVFADMVGAARLKAKYPGVEYENIEVDGDDIDDYDNSYYRFFLAHKDNTAIPQGKLVAVVRNEGVMMRDDGWCQPGTRQIAAWLLENDANPKVACHIILTDSGGGAADSVKDLAEAITSCTKPVVAFCDGDMCSAAYYAASYCSRIVAHDRRDRVGCIGTMIQFGDYPAVTKFEDGYMQLRIYADGSEEKNADYEKALEGDFTLIRENLLNPLASDFREAVAANRPASTAEQRKGRTFFAQDTVGSLIDGIEDFAATVETAVKLSNINITQMKGHENLQSIESCKELEMVDGVASLNEGQLDDIEALLTEKETTIGSLTTERDQFKTQADRVKGLEDQVADLTTERDTLRQEGQRKDARIKELEDALEAANREEEDPLSAMHNGNPGKPSDETEEASDAEAMEYCQKVLKGEI